MCGIVGYVSTSDETHDREKSWFLQDALILDTFRGFDSTGLITLCEDFTVNTHKALLQGWDFVRTDEYNSMPNGWAAIGHNRAATKGKVTKKNAHPFTSRDITLVHNGTLHDMGASLPNYCRKQDVDSMNIARALAHVKPEEALEVLKVIRGAYALAWTDARDQSVNIVRNGQRPLHFAHNAAKSVLWFMSDGKHLEMLKKRGWCTNPDMGDVWQFNTHTLFKWKKGSLKPEVTKYDPFVQRPVYTGPTTVPSYSGPQHSWRGYGGPTNTRKSKPKHRTEPLLHRIFLNGQMVDIPTALRLDLKMAMDLEPKDTLRFEPEIWYPYPDRPERDGYGYVLGTVYVESWEVDWECVVHNIHERHAEKIAMDSWQVIPYAVSEQVPGKSEDDYCVMARIKKFGVKIVDEPKEESKAPAEFSGPFGRKYSLDEWSRLTKDGCSNCSADLLPLEHNSIWWAGEMEKDPLCETCVDAEAHSLANFNWIH